MAEGPANRLLAFVGTYAGEGGGPGGIYTFEISDDGRNIEQLGHHSVPQEAGYLVYSPATETLFAVNEVKTDGRGPVGRASSVHALRLDLESGELAHLGSRPSLGAFPCYLAHDPKRGLLVSANHAGFTHVEKLVQRDDGHWETRFDYDDSTVSVFPLTADGRIEPASDVHLFSGHGKDPNSSPQNGGHAQSGPHAHSAVIDPSGEFLLVCDKGTDRIHVFQLSAKLEEVFVLQLAEETGPRHLAFDPVTGLAFATCEFASTIATLAFDAATGMLEELSQVSTLPSGYDGPNEPAEIRVHPQGGFVYANNRGEDCIAWFAIGQDGQLERQGSVPLAKSLHPGVAARSFAFAPGGSFLMVADRPADLVASYSVCDRSGALTLLAQATVPDPAFVAFARLEPTHSGRGAK
ncbi:conserved hypothetical protein [Altererythrobacter sp. B11]|uniref:lactonase family protein n=1 Tax=Altererythrobacter sp. B11 TaxID=2060312 RepID=UPI000DC6D7AD|nr:lactonase family protein [Altererythrobacter sp. B11]BBC73564.1 conserved hypothetical protein [Altererythrobacter sp. B11]